MRRIGSDKRKGMALGSLAGRTFCACALVASLAPTAALAATDDASAATYVTAGQLAAQDDTTKDDYTLSVTASFTGAKEVTFAGYTGGRAGKKTVAAMTNPTATITDSSGNVLADAVAIGDVAVVPVTDDVAVGTYTATVSSDNFNDVTISFAYPAATSITIGGATYEYLDATTAFSLVSENAKTAALASYSRIGETNIYYKVAEGSTALSGTIYGMDMTSATNYSKLYSSLVSGASFASDDYDAISSATGIVNNKHYGYLSDLVARAIVNDAKVISASDATEEQKLANKLTGAYSTTKTLTGDDVSAYVEASILNAAGQALTDAQSTLLASIRLNGNASTDPTTVSDRVAVDTETASGFYTSWSYFDPTKEAGSKVYGDTKFVIRPTAGTNGGDYAWSDYFKSLYAGTISDTKGNTAGLAPWIDLYAEDGHGAIEMAIGNGQNAYNETSKATVNRFADMYDSATGRLAAGDYTVTLYAAGYNPLSYTFCVGAAVPSADLKSLEIQNASFADGVTATVTKYAADYEDKVTSGKGEAAAGSGDKYATDAAISSGAVALDKILDAGDYKVTFSDGTVYTFSVTLASADELKSLKTALENAEKISSGDYTAASYGVLASAIASAKDALAQESVMVATVNKQLDSLSAATKALVKKGAQTITASNVTKTFGDAAFSLGAKLTAGDGKLSYASSNAKVATIDAAGKVTIKGAGTANITVTAAATGNYKAASKTVTVTVNKASQTIKPAKTYTVKLKKVKKKAQKVAVKFKANGGGKVTYKAAKTAKGKVSIAKNGKVTVKKGTKKGTYTLKVKVTAAAKGNYAKTTQTVALKVKVK